MEHKSFEKVIEDLAEEQTDLVLEMVADIEEYIGKPELGFIKGSALALLTFRRASRERKDEIL